MLPIYICEDDKRQLETLRKLISEIIQTEGLSGSMEIVCASTNPLDIIDHLCKNPKQSLYFLDIDLGEYMNGLDLGVKIRSIDPRGYIVIITVHSEMAIMTFRRKIEAMDFIEKDEPLVIPMRVRDCMIHAFELFSTIPESQISKKISFISNQAPMAKSLHEIYFIEAIPLKPGKIRIHEKEKYVEASLTLTKIRKELDKTFYQCHKSNIVNLDHLREIDHGKSVAVMENGKEVKISTRQLKKLEKYYIDFISNK
jgi:two-component system response regulator AgrA